MGIQTKKLETNILELLEKHSELSRFSLFELLCENVPDLKVTTFDWILYNLKQKQIIVNSGRGIYALKSASTFTPAISKQLKVIYSKVQKRYQPTDLLIWETNLLNEFMIHQPFRSMIILETDSDTMDSVFFFLKDNVKNEVYLRSGFALKSTSLGEFMDSYILESKHPIIVQKSISRAPNLMGKKVSVPTLEKILVDVFCDQILFTAYHGAELDHIFRNSFKRYQIDQTQLLSYASRRGKRDQVLSYINSTIGDWKN